MTSLWLRWAGPGLRSGEASPPAVHATELLGRDEVSDRTAGQPLDTASPSATIGTRFACPMQPWQPARRYPMTQILVSCDACGAKLRLRDPKLAGKKIKCPKCGAVCQVPAPAEEAIAEELPPPAAAPS